MNRTSGFFVAVRYIVYVMADKATPTMLSRGMISLSWERSWSSLRKTMVFSLVSSDPRVHVGGPWWRVWRCNASRSAVVVAEFDTMVLRFGKRTWLPDRVDPGLKGKTPRTVRGEEAGKGPPRETCIGMEKVVKFWDERRNEGPWSCEEPRAVETEVEGSRRGCRPGTP
eukprot:scaffold2636_cov340-Pavlova_lutheri.AAC.117